MCVQEDGWGLSKNWEFCFRNLRTPCPDITWSFQKAEHRQNNNSNVYCLEIIVCAASVHLAKYCIISRITNYSLILCSLSIILSARLSFTSTQNRNGWSYIYRHLGLSYRVSMYDMRRSRSSFKRRRRPRSRPKTIGEGNRPFATRINRRRLPRESRNNRQLVPPYDLHFMQQVFNVADVLNKQELCRDVAAIPSFARISRRGSFITRHID